MNLKETVPVSLLCRDRSQVPPPVTNAEVGEEAERNLFAVIRESCCHRQPANSNGACADITRINYAPRDT